MPEGTVKFFSDAKGFGFIAPDDAGSDIFVHISAVERSGLHRLAGGDLVTFEIERNRRSDKLAAVDLQVTGASPFAPDRGHRTGRADGDQPTRPRPERSQGDRGRDPAGAGAGRVKWFNLTMGFGFGPTTATRTSSSISPLSSRRA